MKKQNGITLIALVITIIVLLILAAVSITALTDEDKGVVIKAKQAADKTETASEQENSDIQEILDYANDTDNNENGTTLASQVTSANYGDKISYTANGISEWNILYNDGKNVFVIANDCVENTKLPTATNMSKYDNHLYSAYWETVTGNGASDIKSSVADKFLFSWLDSNSSSTNNNVKAVASLLDTDVWSDFVNLTFAEYAIGGPTLEMFAKSWNAKGYTQIYTNNSTSNGYYIGLSSNPESVSISVESEYNYEDAFCEEAFSDTLYFSREMSFVETSSENTNCCGYWLASPSAGSVSYEGTGVTDSEEYLYTVYFGGAVFSRTYNNGKDYDWGSFGFRPVVMLKDSVLGEKIGDTWILE